MQDLSLETGGPDGGGKGLGVLGNWREGVVVHRHHQLGADHLHRPQGVLRPHGEHVADGQQRHIDLLIRQQGHIGNEAGIVGAFNDCWLDFMDFLSEGLAMPLGALLMSIMVGWEIKPQTLLDEIQIGSKAKIAGFFTICMKFIVPLGMILILIGQIDTFLYLGIF